VAEKLHARGVTVWATDVRAEVLEGLAGRGIRTLALDVASDESISRALETITAASGAPDLLVNVAGLAKPGALEAQPWADVALQFEVNAFGPLRLARALAPAMRERGYGRVVNVSSTNGFVVTPFMGAYSASKYALEALSDALRLELAPWGVEVALIEPGAMKTPFAERAQEALRREAEAAPAWRDYLERFQKSAMWGTGNATDPERVAEVIVKVAFAKRAPPRVLATLDALPSRAISLAPARLRDGLFRRLSGLHHAPGETPETGASGRGASPRADPAEKTGSS
jgi:NAD(P)-dependent dehydrogenase (short-subunit alcohol dehydrogenase family)